MVRWFDWYEEIKWESDGENDYYDSMMGELDERDEGFRSSDLSSAWSRSRRKKDDPEEVILDLMEIQECLRNLLKIHGIPKNTIIEIAPMRNIGMGAATFEDLDNFKGGRIGLDKSIYEGCSADEMMDVYCGVGLHEASHLNHTRKLFRRMQTGELYGQRHIWEGLFEDERIENKVREESPGYSHYLQAAKRALFENKEFGEGVEVFNKIGDLDKINVIIFALIRCPHLLTDEMKKWIDLDGDCVFQSLREMFPDIPKDEDRIEKYGKVLYEWWSKKRTFYDEACGKESRDVAKEYLEKTKSDSSGGSYDGEGSGEGEGSEDVDDEERKKCGEEEEKEGEKEKTKVDKETLMDVHSRIVKHKTNKKEDEEYQKDMEELADSIKDLAKGDDVADDLKDGSMSEKTAEKTDKKLDKIKSKMDKLFSKREERRFSIHDLIRMLKRMSSITDPINSTESIEMARVTEERVEFGEEWISREDESGSGARTRRTVIIHPVATDFVSVKYREGVGVVRGHIARMRNVFRLRLGIKTYKENELREGRLHRRQLAKATISDRLFAKTYSKIDTGLSLCLVLDESGSMGSCSKGGIGSSKATTAFLVAILISEALKGLPGIELEVYSYSSCGHADSDCLIKYLYGKENQKIESIAGYDQGCQNYDHIALKTCGDLFIKNTTNENKMMIVLSDGTPAGVAYGGSWAIQKTKESVDNLEKRGIAVLNVAIAAYRSEDMFKRVLKFTDLPDLINRMRRLIVGIIKKTTEKGACRV